MRIALVHQRHATVGGTERFMNALAAHLAERGHTVEIVCRRHVRPPHSRVRFRRLHGFALGTTWRLWRFAKDVEAAIRPGEQDVVLGLGKTWTHDVVRAGGGCHASYVEHAHRWVRRPWERLLGVGRLKNRVALAIERRAYASPTLRAVITNSEMVKRDVVARHGVPAEAVTVIRNGVDLRRFHPSRREFEGARLRRVLGLDDHERVVLFLGRGFGRKGLDRTLTAFAALRAERPDWHLLVVGRDRRRPAYERQARSLGVADVTHFLGEREDPETAFAAGDVYVLPARYDPFAHTVLEALATGLPVITTDMNGASELLDDATGNVVSASGDVAELTSAMRRWTEPGRAESARDAARALAERHDFPSTLEATTALLMRVAARDAELSASTPEPAPRASSA